MKPGTTSNHKSPRTVHVLAQDEALSSSLVFAIGLLNFDVLPADSLETVLREKQLHDADVILIDCCLITSVEAPVLKALRQGWHGSLVVMAEDEAGCPAVPGDFGDVRILVKPFDFDALTAMLDGEFATTG